MYTGKPITDCLIGDKRFHSLFTMSGLLIAFLLFGIGNFAHADVRRQTYAPAAIGGSLNRVNVWEKYSKRFVKKDGRVIDTGNGGISHSEGQGYGMLLAVAGGDRESFHKIWTWTHRNLFVRGDGLAAWKWSPQLQAVTDRNNATDGDILIAWALAEAAIYWRDKTYLNLALALIRNIRKHTVYHSRYHGVMIKPGMSGFSRQDRYDGPVVNLSYWVFPALQRFAQFDPQYDWTSVVYSGIKLIRLLEHDTSRLPSEWSSLALESPAPASGFHTSFGYNAVRIPLYLAWAGPAGQDQLHAFANAWTSSSSLAQNSNEMLRSFKKMERREPGYAAIFGIAHCITSGQRLPHTFYNLGKNFHYYSATLHALSILAVASVRPSCLDTIGTDKIISATWRASPPKIKIPTQKERKKVVSEQYLPDTVNSERQHHAARHLARFQVISESASRPPAGNEVPVQIGLIYYVYWLLLTLIGLYLFTGAAYRSRTNSMKKNS